MLAALRIKRAELERTIRDTAPKKDIERLETDIETAQQAVDVRINYEAARLAVGRNASLLLLAMVEGTDGMAEPLMLQQLNFAQLHEASLCCQLGSVVLTQRAAAQELHGQRKKLEKMSSEVLDTGFNLHLLMLQLVDFQQFHEELLRDERRVNPFDDAHDRTPDRELRESEMDQQKRAEALAHLNAYSARVEIVNGAGELERVYFRCPYMCELLTLESRHDLLWGVDRETPGKAVIEFFYAADGLHLVS